MIEKSIAKVPSRIWASGRPARARQWDAEFNVAAWARLSGQAGTVQLVVRYLDARNDHVVLVDAAESRGDGSALLSGTVRLRFTDDVEQVQLCLRLSDPAMRYVVEELYMQRRGTALRPQDKLISNY
ncbi:hypothetical protein [Alloalcanivorax gelatiniphagus]|uniref:PilZ domain-containing protein n=1 Tax=Alloalcanivorax gelatiniphagus TaxID=1194167 RepID=A0ABY2XSG9_9GAMM|nr:hypothetical protein [Alloalcanivorax gelatiniphagus]TMW14973.1 hypothetical protein FGS76_01335 [Alloalcanivorax gelatiniphagus]|tara:strand:+ start:10973 stop:11353 length:381 start_codon:yes stop_codon:yes gene_type:complete